MNQTLRVHLGVRLLEERIAPSTLPIGFRETPIVSGLAGPTAMEFAPDGRLFICLQAGTIRVVKNGALLPAPFLSLTVDSSGERGLLSATFDPNFATNHSRTSGWAQARDSGADGIPAL